MTQPAVERFDQWCIVELFGHQRLAGRVQEVTIGGGSMLQIDVPAQDGGEAFTRIYGAGAVYSITPVSEDVARLAARQLRAPAVTVWIPALDRTLPPGSERPDVEGMMDDGEFEDDEDTEGL